MKHLAPLLLILAFAGCNTNTQVTSSASSTGKANASAPYLWGNKTFPKTIRISSSFSIDESTSITEMSTAWKTAVANQKTFFNYGTVTDNNFNVNEPDGIMGVYKATTWPADVSPDALAITQLFGRRYNVGESSEYVSIEHADIIVNYQNFEFDAIDDSTDSGYDLRTVMVHEMGHFLGLQHIPTYSNRPDTDNLLGASEYKASSVMYPSITGSEIKRIPQQKDKNELINKYGISASGASAMVAASPYQPNRNDTGKNVRVIIELKANGDCIHKEDGAEIWRHQVQLKK